VSEWAFPGVTESLKTKKKVLTGRLLLELLELGAEKHWSSIQKFPGRVPVPATATLNCRIRTREKPEKVLEGRAERAEGSTKYGWRYPPRERSFQSNEESVRRLRRRTPTWGRIIQRVSPGGRNLRQAVSRRTPKDSNRETPGYRGKSRTDGWRGTARKSHTRNSAQTSTTPVHVREKGKKREVREKEKRPVGSFSACVSKKKRIQKGGRRRQAPNLSLR